MRDGRRNATDAAAILAGVAPAGARVGFHRGDRAACAQGASGQRVDGGGGNAPASVGVGLKAGARDADARVSLLFRVGTPHASTPPRAAAARRAGGAGERKLTKSSTATEKERMMREPICWTDETSSLATLCADARAFADLNGTDATGGPAAGCAINARVLPLAPPRQGRGVCICSNLTTTADAFAQLSGKELFALPAGLRRHVHDALVGVWQILDLVQRMEEAGLGVEGEGPDDDAAAVSSCDEHADSGACSNGSDQPQRSQTRRVRKAPWLHRVSRALLHRPLPGA